MPVDDNTPAPSRRPGTTEPTGAAGPVPDAGRAGPRTLAAALLAGRGVAAIARASGTDIADSYHVLTLETRHDGDPAARLAPVDARALADTFAAVLPGPALAHIDTTGPTILAPADTVTRGELDTAIECLGRTLGARPSVLVAVAPPADIPEVAAHSRELLTIVRRLGLPPGFYHSDDLALEYQLTRPGPARDQLVTLLDPLVAHPELVHTLRTHIANNLNRQRTARALHIHPNTVDYRLKRIGTLTGFDANEAPGLWYLRSALVASGYAAGDAD
ncbi:PucR family transcriptional regulator [Nocardia sp. NPDC003963]